MKNKSIPQYRQLYEMLRRHITEGMYHVGDLLPSENDLSRLHGLARPTVRQALAALVTDGYIRKQKGKGSIVAPLPKGIGILSIEGTTTALASMNLTTIMVHKPKVMHWPREFMFPLPGEIRESGCIYMERIRLINGNPLFYDISHLPNIHLPRFCARTFENRSLFDTLRRYYGLEVRGGEQKLRALPAGKKVARYLKIPEGTPVLHLERKLDTNRAGYSFYSSIYCITHEHALFGTF